MSTPPPLIIKRYEKKMTMKAGYLALLRTMSGIRNWFWLNHSNSFLGVNCFLGHSVKNIIIFIIKKNLCTQVKTFDEKYVVTNRKLRSTRFKWHVIDSHENSLVYKVSIFTVLLSQLDYTRGSGHRKIWIKKNISHSGTWINEFFFQRITKNCSVWLDRVYIEPKWVLPGTQY